MELDYKARNFLIQALEYRIEWYEEQLARTDLGDDEQSDLTNDRYYLQALLDDLWELQAGPGAATQR